MKGVWDRGEHDRGTHEEPNNTSDILVARVAGSGSVCWRHLLVAVPTSHHTTASLLLLMQPTLHLLDDARLAISEKSTSFSSYWKLFVIYVSSAEFEMVLNLHFHCFEWQDDSQDGLIH